MARLIHLNGPPGVGKSALANRYAQAHPGALNLDVDRLRPFVGGWRERFDATGELIRPLALSMARTHLTAGADVVLPQYLGKHAEIEKFADAARENGAEFIEIILRAERETVLARFHGRVGNDLDEHVRAFVEQAGGVEFLVRMHDQLDAIGRERPAARWIDCQSGDLEHSYRALRAVIDD